MKMDKQLNLKEVIEKVVRNKCISCGTHLNKPISYRWKVPLCRKCRLEFLEDIADG